MSLVGNTYLTLKDKFSCIIYLSVCYNIFVGEFILKNEKKFIHNIFNFIFSKH